MKTRISKFLSESGVASRREAEKLIEQGKVFVNGEKVTTPVFFIEGTEEIEVNGKRIDQDLSSADSRLYAFNKPINTMTTTSDPEGRQTVYDVLPKKYRNLKYIGRLDYKTTGLLLLTNNGELARQMTLPSSGLKRVYEEMCIRDRPYQSIRLCFLLGQRQVSNHLMGH